MGVIKVFVGAEDDDLQVGLNFFGLDNELMACHFRHFDIGQQNMYGHAAQDFQRFRAGSRRNRVEIQSILLNEIADPIAIQFLVIHNQDTVACAVSGH